MSTITRREFLQGLAAALAAASFLPATPDDAFAAPAVGTDRRGGMVARAAPSAIGMPLDRLDGPLKVRGAAPYAYEHPVDRPAYLYPVLSTVASGRVARIDVIAAAAEPGVLAVLTHENAPRLVSTAGQGGPGLVPTSDPELAVLQSDAVAFRGQIVGAVIAESSEAARHAASLVRVEYEARAHDVAFGAGRDDLRKPVNAANAGYGVGEIQDGSPADTAHGDLAAGLAAAAVTLDATYTTPPYHHNPMEPHTTIAIWAGDALTLYTSTQGVHRTRAGWLRCLGSTRSACA